MKKIEIETNESNIDLESELKLNLIEPDFTSINQLKGDKNVLEYAFKTTKLELIKDGI